MTAPCRGGRGVKPVLAAVLLTMVAMVVACTRAPAAPEVTATAAAETVPVPNSGDAADDPALWIDARDPAHSLVLGTDKDGGLGVYDLRGRQVRYLVGGRPNNVDVRGDLVVASDRADDTLRVWRVDPATRELADVAARPLRMHAPVYGLCLWSAPDGTVHAFVGDEHGRFQQWRLRVRPDGRVDGTRVRRFAVGSTAEGCVADDRRGLLYVAEEARGIWRYDTDPAAGSRRSRVDRTGGGGHLTADVEGLALYQRADGRSWLVASSQGSDSYVVYDHRNADRYAGTVRVTDGHIDGTSKTDGIEATSRPLGPRFPDGLLVVQDDDNDDGGQNFKLVDWRDIERQL